jgi:nucleoside-diphosphate-sugar epimerase
MSKNQSDCVLVAGGAGFVGSNLIKRLLSNGRRVHCVDNFSTGYQAAVAEFEKHKQFQSFRGDITDSQFMSRFEDNHYAEIYNLACPTGVPNIAPLGEAMLLTSSIGSLNLLRMAQNSGAKYLYTSTAEIYGDPEVVPQIETYNGNVDPVGPRSAYEEGKRFGEALTAHFARGYGIDARIIRVFNTYGPNMSPHDMRVIPQMLSRMALQQPVTIYGDGSNTRSFLHVNDLIDGFMITMNRHQCGEVYNIGGEDEMAILALFELCKRVTGYSRKPIFKSHFIADHKRRLPGTERIRNLGWKPRVSAEEGLASSYFDMATRLHMRSEKPKSARLHSLVKTTKHRMSV